MKNFFLKFRKSESGAISVDWVVLTATVVGLSGASALLIGDGVESLSGTIGEGVESQPVGVTN
jgi:Flp pilus assembly pilin Flp